MSHHRFYQGDSLDVLRKLDSQSVHCCVTSPPYWGLRDYGVEGQIGLEKTPEEYVSKLVEVFREVRRVLRDDGTLWLNLGDCYAKDGISGMGDPTIGERNLGGTKPIKKCIPSGLKPKDLVGIPWRVAFALQADGWYLRSDIIWCLSGGTWLYVKSQKGEMPMMVKDIARLDPKTIKLWNGEKWTQLLGISCSQRKGNEIELVLRSGERISCTPSHKFPTQRGLLEAKDIKIGDVLQSCILPEPETPKDCVIDEDAAWLAGLYIAEGSMSGDTIQITGHIKETERWQRLQKIARKYGGSTTRSIVGNTMSIRLYGKVLRAIIAELVAGKTAKDKGFSPIVWRYSNSFLRAMLNGYLSGDGHWDEANNRWRICFTRNYSLERDLRTACARLGCKIKLNLSNVKYKGETVPIFKGEIRTSISGHHNCKPQNEVVQIRKARCRQVWDLGVADEPHLFALASGILTHNSKPNPMPESVTDRPTKAHEYIFLLSKSERYYYDAEAIKEPYLSESEPPRDKSLEAYNNSYQGGRWSAGKRDYYSRGGRNKRTVWTVATQPFPEAHFATFPPKLIEPCILAGCPEDGIILDPFAGAGTTNMVAKKLGRSSIYIDLNPEYLQMAIRRMDFETLELFEKHTFEQEIVGGG